MLFDEERGSQSICRCCHWQPSGNLRATSEHLRATSVLVALNGWSQLNMKLVDCLAKIDAVYLYLSSAVLIMANKYHVCNWLSLL